MSYQKRQREWREAIELLRDIYSRDEEFTAANWMAHHLPPSETLESPYLIDILRWLFCDMAHSMKGGYEAILPNFPRLEVVVKILKEQRKEDLEEIGMDAGWNWDSDLIAYLDKIEGENS